MGSLFTAIDPSRKDYESLLHKGKPSPQFIQFVPGIVKRVITNPNCIGYTMPKHINTIMAIPHISDRVPADSDGERYYPLLRGIADVPAVGDPVLLCTFGDVNYYLGPLNTDNNPNFNEDQDYTPYSFENSLSYSDINGTITLHSDKELTFTSGITISDINKFPYGDYKRITKEFSPRLDLNGNTEENLSSLDVNNEIYPIHGDMVLEGNQVLVTTFGPVTVTPSKSWFTRSRKEPCQSCVETVRMRLLLVA